MYTITHAASCSTQGENNSTSSQPHYYNISLHIQGTKQWGPFHQANCLCVRGSKLFLYLSVMKPFFLITNRALVSQRDLHYNLQLNHRAKLSIFPRQFFRLPHPQVFFSPPLYNYVESVNGSRNKTAWLSFSTEPHSAMPCLTEANHKSQGLGTVS